MAQRILTLDGGDYEFLKSLAPLNLTNITGTGTISSDVVTIDDAYICKVLYEHAVLPAGEKYVFELQSNLIFAATTSIAFGSIVCRQGLLVFSKIYEIVDGHALIEILNIGSQAKDTEDVDDESILLTIIIL